MAIDLVSFIIGGSTALGRCTKKSKLMRLIERAKIVKADELTMEPENLNIYAEKISNY